jgi:hypothetical protein
MERRVYLRDGKDMDRLSRRGFQVVVLSRASGHTVFQESQAERVCRLGASRFGRASELVAVRIIWILVQELLVASAEPATNGVQIGITASREKVVLGCWVPGFAWLMDRRKTWTTLVRLWHTVRDCSPSHLNLSYPVANPLKTGRSCVSKLLSQFLVVIRVLGAWVSCT